MASVLVPACLTILLVEDDTEVRMTTAAMARELGHTVFEASNAEDGMALLATLPINTLIADIGLPGVSGEVFAAHARGLRPSLGIVFATGSADFANVPNDGTNTVVVHKPYDSSALHRALSAVSSARPDTDHSVRGA